MDLANLVKTDEFSSAVNYLFSIKGKNVEASDLKDDISLLHIYNLIKVIEQYHIYNNITNAMNLKSQV